MTHDDPEVRRRAGDKALAWEAVLDGMASGRLAVGSRTPVADTPAWVTLEVAHGGFATGRYVAAGELTGDERALLAEITGRSRDEDRDEDHPALVTDRHRLNTWYLSDDGLARLTELLRTGCYEVAIPEHGALLVVAWLLDNGHEPAALDLVATLHPFFDRLRFYPVATDRPPAGGDIVRLRTVGEVAGQLGQVTVPPQVAAMHETIRVWHPLYDRLVALWRTTVEDGWPCRRWPDGWTEQRRRWLDDYAEAARRHPRSREHRKPRSTLAVLRTALERCEHDSSALTGRDVGRIRAALDRSVARWGEPGSPRHAAVRDAQAGMATRPTNEALAGVVVERLAPLPDGGGIADLDPIVAPVAPAAGNGDEPTPLPRTLVRKVERALEAPIEELVERRLVTSSETLALLLPQLSSQVAAARLADPALREVYARTYAAFRRRRSLLLLDLEHQVQIDELPWIAALAPLPAATDAPRTRAGDTLRRAALLALTSFPQTILPNRLVRELDALSRQAEAGIPFVEEVAADIFMGTFTTKWRRAAARAATLMAGTLYARYYDLPDATTWPAAAGGDGGDDIHDSPGTGRRWNVRTAEDFTEVCQERAKEAQLGDGVWVARNGTVIEQSQILTTHNLASLTYDLGLAEQLRPRAQDLAVDVFEWIVGEQTTRRDDWRAQLHMTKNTAYAWRQAIFLLSLVDVAQQREAVAHLQAAIAHQPYEWHRRFQPVADGLALVIDGGSFGPDGRLGPGRRFLGWTVGRHWIFPDPPPGPDRRRR